MQHYWGERTRIFCGLVADVASECPIRHWELGMVQLMVQLMAPLVVQPVFHLKLLMVQHHLVQRTRIFCGFVVAVVYECLILHLKLLLVQHHLVQGTRIFCGIGFLLPLLPCLEA
jgi:hypothetical protein